MILFSVVGDHDVIEKSQGGYGAALNVYLEYRDAITQVLQFVTESRRSDEVVYGKVVRQNKALLESEKPETRVKVVPVRLTNPVDFDVVYPTSLRATQNLLERDEIRTREKIISITCGTPTVTACWVVLHKSGLIPNFTLIQRFEPKCARGQGTATQEVNLEIEHFSQITAPENLRLQSDIARRENQRV